MGRLVFLHHTYICPALRAGNILPPAAFGGGNVVMRIHMKKYPYTPAWLSVHIARTQIHMICEFDSQVLTHETMKHVTSHKQLIGFHTHPMWSTDQVHVCTNMFSVRNHLFKIIRVTYDADPTLLIRWIGWYRRSIQLINMKETWRQSQGCRTHPDE